MNIEKELDACFKALAGENIVVCPHCGTQFNYDDAEKTTFQQMVLDQANNYVRWITEDIVAEQIRALEPSLRTEVLSIIDAVKGQKQEITEKSVADFASYARCPHCWGRVYSANALLSSEPAEAEIPVETEKQAEAPQVTKSEDSFFEDLNKCI